MLEWQDKAACKSADLSRAEKGTIFFPAPGESLKPAQAICGSCDVRVECLYYAIDNYIDHGIWGGLSENHRQRIRKQRAK